ncbi:MAG: type II toxin-antitoxin system PemK/MazF family toxin [Candidatus Aminicenantes bacterium]|nr:type II toxin-antitoxin system PemK/MazF family toxin [Candidatus Aminicenantes bacterium]
MTVRQGDVYWVNLRPPRGSEPGYRHPVVVVQNDVYNASKIATVVVCLLTTNLDRARVLGNVLLKKSEANLPRASVLVVGQIKTLDHLQLGEKIGTLSNERVGQIVSGLKLLLEPRSL